MLDLKFVREHQEEVEQALRNRGQEISLEEFRRRRLPHRVVTLPCGHYTTGRFPFNWIDGLAMCRFAARHL